MLPIDAAAMKEESQAEMSTLKRIVKMGEGRKECIINTILFVHKHVVDSVAMTGRSKAEILTLTKKKLRRKMEGRKSLLLHFYLLICMKLHIISVQLTQC